MHNKMKYIFASGVGALAHMMDKNAKWRNSEFDYNFTGFDSFYHYPNILVSAAHRYDDFELRKDWKIPPAPGGFLVGDSGGYQLATGNFNMGKMTFKETRTKIFEWLEHNCDLSMNLDHPPFTTGQSADAISQADFDRCLHSSVDNYKYFEDQQTGKTNFLNVLQGRSVEQINYWYDHVKDFQFQGWAIGGARNFTNVLIGVKMLMDKGEFDKPNNKYLHLLGISSAELLIYIVYLQILLNNAGVDIQVTCDSSSPNLASGFGSYYLFSKPSGYTFLSLKRDTVKPGLELPCNCPVCSQVKTVDDIIVYDSAGYGLMALHNLWMTVQYIDRTQKVLEFDNKDILASIFQAKIYRNLVNLQKVFSGHGDIRDIMRNFKVVESEIRENESPLDQFFSDE